MGSQVGSYSARQYSKKRVEPSLKTGTGILYLNDKAFKFNEGDTVDIGTVKTGDVLKIEINPKPFTPFEGSETQVSTDLDELSSEVVDLNYKISGTVYSWSTTLNITASTEDLKDYYYIGGIDSTEEPIYFIKLKLTI